MVDVALAIRNFEYFPPNATGIWFIIFSIQDIPLLTSTLSIFAQLASPVNFVAQRLKQNPLWDDVWLYFERQPSCFEFWVILFKCRVNITLHSTGFGRNFPFQGIPQKYLENIDVAWRSKCLLQDLYD